MDVTNLKISVSSFDESEASIDEMVERINQDINNNNLSIENKVKQKENIKIDNVELEKKIKELETEIESINEKVSNSSSKVTELKENRMTKNEELSKAETDFTAQIEILDGLKEQILKIDVKKSKIEQDIDLVVNKLWEEYELTPNNVENYTKPENVQETTKKVNSLRNKIKDLGSINIDAIEEYNQTKQRYDFMCEQRLDLDNTASKLRKVIADMTETMKIQFAEKFKQINKNFNEVFVELFGGGKAELILEDENNILECGIDIQVQPTGKKLQKYINSKILNCFCIFFVILIIINQFICQCKRSNICKSKYFISIFFYDWLINSAIKKIIRPQCF